MTDKELQQLASEYAEQNPPAGIKDDVLRENAISLNAEIFAKHLRWLSSRYCIVEKSKVRDEWVAAHANGWIVSPYLRGRFRVLQDLFPELFNEEK